MKKGFTLIEVLGILVVLSVIILVAVPSIIQTNKNANKSEIENTRKTIFMAADTYINLEDSRKSRFKKNNYYYIKLSDLVSSGLLSDSLKNPETNLEKTIVEDSWWVEVRLNNGNTNYKIVSKNPYIDEENESTMAYTMLIDKKEAILVSNNKYVYRDANPNNYVKFNNELWRIVSLESDKTVKIVRYDFLGTEGKYADNWQFTNLISNLNENYFNDFSPKAQRMVATGKFAGNNKVGILTPSDYVEASANKGETNSCTESNSVNATSSNHDPCILENYLYKNNTWWIINPSGQGIVIKGNEGITSNYSGDAKVRPAVYLTADTTIISGDGSYTKPYVLEK